MSTVSPIGDLLRTWRQRRHLSQLELAGAANISARHVSFLETGRSLPSREMLLRLARERASGPTAEERLGSVVVPLRLRTENGSLSFFSTTTVFGTPLDITLAELAIESFFPADSATAELLSRVARGTKSE